MAPTGIAWQYWRTAVLPSSATAGPMVVHGDVAPCFAHSPLGALIGAVQIPTRDGASDRAPEWQSDRLWPDGAERWPQTSWLP